MGGKRRPRSGIPRVFPDLRCAEAVECRRFLGELEAKHGPFDSVTRDYAASVAVLRMGWQTAESEVSDARQRRREAKGRRPSSAQVARLRKRASLEWQSFDAALATLRELVAEQQRHRRPRSGLELLEGRS
jgi:hypothetical protein